MTVRTRERVDREAALIGVEQAFTVRAKLIAQVGVAIEPGVYPLLRRIADWGPIRNSELALRIGLDVSTVSRQVAGLERAGLVMRAVDPDDGRAALLALSAEGTRVMTKLQRARRALMGDALAEWPVEDLERLGELLEQFADALDGIR